MTIFIYIKYGRRSLFNHFCLILFNNSHAVFHLTIVNAKPRGIFRLFFANFLISSIEINRLKVFLTFLVCFWFLHASAKQSLLSVGEQIFIRFLSSFDMGHVPLFSRQVRGQFFKILRFPTLFLFHFENVRSLRITRLHYLFVFKVTTQLKTLIYVCRNPLLIICCDDG